ncbi:MAG: dihydropyrimidinase [Firmicutes bacterium]|nr:dihydropyrimidinase [Bacillota bacterium]
MNTLIKQGTIITSSDIFRGDVYIEDDKIFAIAEQIDLPEGKSDEVDQIINAEGKYVIPGGIDVHTHFQLPVMGTVSADTFESGSKAGACGGITTFIDFAHQVPGESALKAINDRLKEAEGNCFIDYGLHLGITDFKTGIQEEMPEFIEMGIPSFKLYMVYPGLMSNDAVILAMLRAIKDLGGLIIIHAENAAIIDYLIAKNIKEGRTDITAHPLSRPDFTETEAVKRALYLTEVAGSRIYIVHMSTGESAAAVAEAKGRGVTAFAETCPQYLIFTDDEYSKADGHLCSTSPPLRKAEDQTALWKGLSMGAIQVVSTDTCSFTKAQKEAGRNDFTKLPGGIAGIETLMPLMHSEGVLKGRISLNQWVELLSANPAKMFGLYPSKGTLMPGSDADIVVFDPMMEYTIGPDTLHYNADYTPFDGMKVTGKPVLTMLRGKVIYRDGSFTGEKGYGKFVRRYYTP